MRTGSILFLAAIASMAGTSAFAQEGVDRYRLERTPDGYVRMDTVTGRMSTCQEQGGQLVCRLAIEDMDAYDRDIDALRDRINVLERRLTAMESGRPAANLPDEQEFEQTLGYMERFFRLFMGLVKEFESDKAPATPDSAPGRPDTDRT